MLQTLTTAAATLLILLACHYLYRASPQQHWPGAPPDPARARRLAWRYALAALLLNTLALGGYSIATSLAVAMTALGLMPLIPLLPRIYPPNPFPALIRWLNAGEPRPAWLAKIAAAKQRGSKVWSVGTTSLRAIESAARSGSLKAGQGDTDIFITPGFQFQVIDRLITNFHLPKSTLLMLVSAFSGCDKIRAVYRHAVEQEYRFFSYGDAMILARETAA